MGMIKEEYLIYYRDRRIGTYYVYTNRRCDYCVYDIPKEDKKALEALGLDRDLENRSKKSIPILFEMKKDVNRVPGTRKRIYQSGDVKMERVPEDTDKFWIYRRRAKKGEAGYSEKDHSAPHKEGSKEIEGMREWASWYCFNKKDDGMYEAELDEAWWWGGSHNDGGTIRTEVPEEWLALSYDEFLDRVVTLSAAAHYGFTAEELKEKEGLKAFFGFE